MKIKDLTGYLEEIAPLAYQESYDNAGLIVGDPNREISNALICLDCTEAVVDEAIENQFDIIIAHHPIVFKGLKKLNGKNYVERVVIKAIKHDIAIYAIHTNLDHVHVGVSKRICDRLSLINTRVLAPKTGLLKKLVTFVPNEHKEQVKQALFTAGAGQIGDYEECSYETNGLGNFKAKDGASPYVGNIGTRHTEEEKRIEVIFPSYLERKLVNTLINSHPYEEPAFDIYALGNAFSEVGAGMVGELPQEMDALEFLHSLKQKMNAQVIRHTPLLEKPIRKVAVCGGAGSFLLKDAIRAGADVYVSADFKYHEFFDAEDKIVIADIGHFESEQFTQHLLLEIIQKKFPKFALRLTVQNTNPIKYLS
ncbi:Nif3-like dinuclear metal center hexameric protein [Pseudopedobacter beijingensis]|uniref:GTP cyclohydrolase 1 type 2 homolog n=1 Tax=Pseudopedobacter beijingensis TaxID=1207056 RepID=A0ABW4I9D2_9SPHI